MNETAFDNQLQPWSTIAGTRNWKTLFVGNGLSVNIWRKFAYASLFEDATDLTDRDKKLFEALDTTNFELVLSDLNAAIRMSDALGLDKAEFEARYLSIQRGLGSAVRAVHIEPSSFPIGTLPEIRDELKKFKYVFSTSYDLILYWAMGAGPADDPFGGFVDFMWSNMANEFDPARTNVFSDPTRVYFVHGALHLIVKRDGTTRKLTADKGALLEQFGNPIAGEPDARPLLISEGSWREKQRAIDGNDYLSFAVDRLRDNSDPLVVFGHSLSDHDQHLVDAINANPDRPVAVGLRAGNVVNRWAIKQRKAEVASRLHTNDLEFFDSSSFPLGSSDLSISEGWKQVMSGLLKS